MCNQLMMFRVLLEPALRKLLYFCYLYCRAADYVMGTPVRVDNPFKHGVSALLLLGDLALSRVPLVSYHIQVRAGGRRESLRTL